MNWDDPQERFHLIEQVGVDEYNKRFAEHRKKSVIVTVNGHDIYPFNSGFGRIYWVDGTNAGFQTLDQAMDFAEKLEKGGK